jgi:hypothetical protein
MPNDLGISVRVTFEILGLDPVFPEPPMAEATFDGKPTGADLRHCFDKLLDAVIEKCEEAEE